MKQARWIINKTDGIDTCTIDMGDGRTLLSIERKRRGRKMTTVTSFMGEVLFEEPKLDDDQVLLTILETLKVPFDDVRTKLGVSTPNVLGYTQSVFMLELRQFIMTNDPNCIVLEKHFPR